MTTPRAQLLAAFQEPDPVTNFEVSGRQWANDVNESYWHGVADERKKCDCLLLASYACGWIRGFLLGAGLGVAGLIFVWWWKG